MACLEKQKLEQSKFEQHIEKNLVVPVTWSVVTQCFNFCWFCLAKFLLLICLFDWDKYKYNGEAPPRGPFYIPFLTEVHLSCSFHLNMVPIPCTYIFVNPWNDIMGEHQALLQEMWKKKKTGSCTLSYTSVCESPTQLHAGPEVWKRYPLGWSLPVYAILVSTPSPGGNWFFRAEFSRLCKVQCTMERAVFAL